MISRSTSGPRFQRLERAWPEFSTIDVARPRQRPGRPRGRAVSDVERDALLVPVGHRESGPAAAGPVRCGGAGGGQLDHDHLRRRSRRAERPPPDRRATARGPGRGRRRARPALTWSSSSHRVCGGLRSARRVGAYCLGVLAETRGADRGRCRSPGVASAPGRGEEVAPGRRPETQRSRVAPPRAGRAMISSTERTAVPATPAAAKRDSMSARSCRATQAPTSWSAAAPVLQAARHSWRTADPSAWRVGSLDRLAETRERRIAGARRARSNPPSCASGRRWPAPRWATRCPMRVATAPVVAWRMTTFLHAQPGLVEADVGIDLTVAAAPRVKDRHQRARRRRGRAVQASASGTVTGIGARSGIPSRTACRRTPGRSDRRPARSPAARSGRTARRAGRRRRWLPGAIASGARPAASSPPGPVVLHDGVGEQRPAARARARARDRRARRATDDFPRFSVWKQSESSPAMAGPRLRSGEPPGGSTLMTQSRRRSASRPPASSPARVCASSTTTMPRASAAATRHSSPNTRAAFL